MTQQRAADKGSSTEAAGWVSARSLGQLAPHGVRDRLSLSGCRGGFGWFSQPSHSVCDWPGEEGGGRGRVGDEGSSGARQWAGPQECVRQRC